jgi:hypothetical protein
MAEIYSPKCAALTTDLASRCRSCGRRDPGGRGQAAAGAVFVVALVGAVITAIYGRLVYLACPKWERLFGGGEPGSLESAGYSQEAAFLSGAGVFIISSMLAHLCLQPTRVVSGVTRQLDGYGPAR